MNIEIIGRIRPSIRAEGPENLVIEGHRVAAQTKGPFIKYGFIFLRDPRNSSKWVLDSPFSVGTHKSQIFISYKIFINVFWTNQIKLLQVSLFPMNGIMSHFVGNWFLCKIQIQVVFSGTTMYLQFWSTEVGEGRQHFKVYYFDSNRAFTVILCIQAYIDRGYFWALFQLPPAIIYKNI
jgi:hypothetical protein